MVGQDAAGQRPEDVAVTEVTQDLAPVGLVETVLRKNARRGIGDRAAVNVVEQCHQHDQEENLVAERRNSCAVHRDLTLQMIGRSQKVGRVRRIFIVLPKRLGWRNVETEKVLVNRLGKGLFPRGGAVLR
ncbi:hypothetical protein D3C75_1102770 [compost metagenome]